MKSTLLFSTILAVFAPFTVAEDLKPLMVVPAKIAVENDFSTSGALPKKTWSQRQHTRWEIKDGVLLGKPSTAEFQATAKDHKGLEPRISVPATPAEFAASFSVTFRGGDETSICPFVEFGHHVCRLKFSETEGLKLIADGETVVLAAAPGFKFERDKKYINPLSPLSDPLNSAPKRPTPKANS